MQNHVKTLTLDLTWPIDLRVSACRGPVMDYMSTDLGADSSSHKQTDKLTDVTEHPTQAGGIVYRQHG